MNAIAPKIDRVQRLLEKGYFPAQLPPCFTTKDLAANHATLFDLWSAFHLARDHEKDPPKAPRSRPELFTVARAGHQRRVTSITNPVAQVFLATHVVRYWGQIIKQYRRSKLSASRPRFTRRGARAASIPSMRLLYEEKIRRGAGYRYMLRTDVSRFFPTIYTHVVSWALHGKAVAKQRQKRPYTSRHFGNILDLCLRQGQDGQTIGLPIGPDTSHIIAEAIATGVDREFKKALRKVPAGFRYVDDYFMFFPTLQEADSALAALVGALKEFELEINVEKTKVCRVIEIAEDYWPHQLRSFVISNDPRQQSTDVSHFFEKARDLARRNSDESVMAYALKRASSVIIRRDNWDSFEAHLCHAALAYPNTLQTVARILSTYAGNGYALGHDRLQRLINAIVQDHAPLNHHSEVAWSLWIAKELNLELAKASIDAVARMQSSICALILLDLEDAGRLIKKPARAHWRHQQDVEALHGGMWLLSYEAGIRGWGGFTNGHVRQDRHFSLLEDKSVSFYDRKATLPPIFQIKSTAPRTGSIFDIDRFLDLDNPEKFIEFESPDSLYGEGSIREETEREPDPDPDGSPEEYPFV